jgi:hypothetical protein
MTDQESQSQKLLLSQEDMRDLEEELLQVVTGGAGGNGESSQVGPVEHRYGPLPDNVHNTPGAPAIVYHDTGVLVNKGIKLEPGTVWLHRGNQVKSRYVQTFPEIVPK